MRIVFANDYSSGFHCGSRLLNEHLKRELARLGEITARIPHDRLTHDRWWSALAACDVLVINGEGNFHGGNPVKLGQICLLAARARSLGKRVALVNTVAFNLPAPVDLGVFDFIAVRESASRRTIESHGYRGPLAVAQDATLLEEFAAEAPRRDVIVTDCVVRDSSAALRRLCRDLAARGVATRFQPFRRRSYPRISPRRVLSRFGRARLVVSGRYHANCFALITGTPFVSVDSNSHKTRALMEDLGLARLHFDSVEELAHYLLQAGPGRVPEVGVPALSIENARAEIVAALRAAVTG